MGCSKILPALPEITSEIIQYLQNDFLTLHSCILVNRLWCRLAIPLLWEDPFSKNRPKNYHFIDIYLNKLNEDDKTKLNEYGITFPSSTLFNYPSFIKCLSTRTFSSSISYWIDNAKDSKFNKDSKLSKFIFLSLIKIFIKNEASLHTFEVSTTLGMIDNDSFKSFLQLILQNPKIYSYCSLNFMDFIFNLKSLRMNYSNNLLSFQDFPKLFNSQQNLKTIFLDYSSYPLTSLKYSNCSNTLKVIIFHKVYLNNWGVNFNEVFEQLNVLDSIHILYCYPLNSSFIQQIINLTKPFKLKSLFMDEGTVLQIESLELLLQKFGNYLENIGFESSIDHEFKFQLFKLAKIYCNKIKFLEILEFDDQNIYSSFDLMKNIQHNLNYLSINFCQFGCYQLSYDDKLSSIVLQNLGQILPYRLEYLSLALKFNINDLEVFFKNSKNTFIKKLLIRNKMYQKSEEILPCIKKYAMKEKRVANLAIESLLYYSNNIRKELFHLKDEVEEFKFYDIQVTSYDNLCIKVHDFINKLYY
ncbi:hypothetical protein C1646_812178 [Rhizophagus diaphanus]|nr:hypothetical protein C1646_812178 [Rhizophagus diaphanus] [Rhizophagus sp. MUCL 43196]